MPREKDRDMLRVIPLSTKAAEGYPLVRGKKGQAQYPVIGRRRELRFVEAMASALTRFVLSCNKTFYQRRLQRLAG